VTLSWGAKPNAGYRITIDKIEFQADHQAVIYYGLHYPDPEGFYAQMMTEPKAETFVGSEYMVSVEPSANSTLVHPHAESSSEMMTEAIVQ
jgi:hypothetical protein